MFLKIKYHKPVKTFRGGYHVQGTGRRPVWLSIVNEKKRVIYEIDIKVNFIFLLKSIICTWLKKKTPKL